MVEKIVDKIDVILMLSVWLGLFSLILAAWYYQAKAQRNANLAVKANFEKDMDNIENDVNSTPLIDLVKRANERKRKDS